MISFNALTMLVGVYRKSHKASAKVLSGSSFERPDLTGVISGKNRLIKQKPKLVVRNLLTW